MTCYAKGWHELRKEDLGFLWEHCVLNEMQGHLQTRKINYWRDKQNHEIDFVIPRRGDGDITVIECKFNIPANTRDHGEWIKNISENVQAFRKHYPKGQNFIVASNIEEWYTKKIDSITLTFVNPTELIKRLSQR